MKWIASISFPGTWRLLADFPFTGLRDFDLANPPQNPIFTMTAEVAENPGGLNGSTHLDQRAVVAQNATLQEFAKEPCFEYWCWAFNAAPKISLNWLALSRIPVTSLAAANNSIVSF